MAYKHLGREPQNIKNDKSTWYYEENHAILIVHQSEDGKFHNIKIPWRMLRKSLERKDRKL